MNRELTREEIEDQKRLWKILHRHKLNEWLGGTDFYVQLIRNIEAMQQTGTTDGEDLAELTDDDARERPWVMVSDDRVHWMRNPKTLLSAPPTSARYVVVDNIHDDVATAWKHARRATENELKQAGITK